MFVCVTWKKNKIVCEDSTIQSIMLKESKGRVNNTERQIQYDMLDVNTYHEIIITKFKNLININ